MTPQLIGHEIILDLSVIRISEILENPEKSWFFVFQNSFFTRKSEIIQFFGNFWRKFGKNVIFEGSSQD